MTPTAIAIEKLVRKSGEHPDTLARGLEVRAINRYERLQDGGKDEDWRAIRADLDMAAGLREYARRQEVAA